MTIKFNKSEAFQNAKVALTAVLSKEEVTEQETTQAYENYFEALQTDVLNTIRTQVND